MESRNTEIKVPIVCIFRDILVERVNCLNRIQLILTILSNQQGIAAVRYNIILIMSTAEKHARKR